MRVRINKVNRNTFSFYLNFSTNFSPKILRELKVRRVIVHYTKVCGKLFISMDCM